MADTLKIPADHVAQSLESRAMDGREPPHGHLLVALPKTGPFTVVESKRDLLA